MSGRERVIFAADGGRHGVRRSAPLLRRERGACLLRLGAGAGRARLARRGGNRAGRSALRAGGHRVSPGDTREPPGALRGHLRSRGGGELLVAQTSLVGSILANALLIQGLVIVTGVLASDDDVMRFRTRLPQDAATLGLVTIFVIVVIGLTIESSSEASHHIQGLSIVGASCLLVVLVGLWAWGYLRSDVPPGAGGGTARLSIPRRDRIPRPWVPSALPSSRTGSSMRSIPRSARSGSPRRSPAS